MISRAAVGFVMYAIASTVLLSWMISAPPEPPTIRTEYVVCEDYKAVVATQIGRINEITEATNFVQHNDTILLRVSERLYSISDIIAKLEIPKCIDTPSHWLLVRSINHLAYSYDVRVNGNPAEADVLFNESAKSISIIIDKMNGATNHD